MEIALWSISFVALWVFWLYSCFTLNLERFILVTCFLVALFFFFFGRVFGWLLG